jgi:hypothetical protein
MNRLNLRMVPLKGSVTSTAHLRHVWTPAKAQEVSTTCEPAVAALQSARRLTDQGVKNALIDAGGMEYAPADFKRLFVEPGPITT